MNTYLIISEEINGSEILKDRIKRIGSHYRIFNTCWAVRSEKNTPKDVYDFIIGEDMPIQNILVVYINDIGGYWGFLKRDIWDWLDYKDYTNDDIVKFPAKMIEELNMDRIIMQNQIKELNLRISSLQNTICSLKDRNKEQETTVDIE